nr:hypothetical protein [Aneurinibacillus tyrosinisolvens]
MDPAGARKLEVDVTFIAAILTIIGYSINDTIAIFEFIFGCEPLHMLKIHSLRKVQSNPAFGLYFSCLTLVQYKNRERGGVNGTRIYFIS